MNRWDKEAFEYSELDRLKAALVGKSITSTVSEGESYERIISFVLNDGTILRAHATNGGCACSNGCFTVEPGSTPVAGTITNVEVSEQVETYDTDGPKEVTPGSVSDGEARIRIYVYADMDKALLIESEGGDNGYYGWGFWLDVLAPEQEATDD